MAAINPEYIKAQLQRWHSQRQLKAVSDVSGVSIRTLHRLVRGAAGNLGTCTQLEACLRKIESQKKPRDSQDKGASDGRK